MFLQCDLTAYPLIELLNKGIFLSPPFFPSQHTPRLHAMLLANGCSRAGISTRSLTSSLRTTSFIRPQQRNLQDIAITRTGKPIIRVPGGRWDGPASSANLQARL